MKTFSIIQKIDKFTENLPSWFNMILGIAAILLGIAILTKPFNSISLMVALLGLGLIVDGLGRLLKKGNSTNQLTVRAIGGVIALAGLVVLVAPSMSVSIIVLIAGASLLLSAFSDLLGALNGSKEHRFEVFIRGLATMILGILVLTWQDVAILVLAVAFSIKLIFAGVSLVYRSIRKKNHSNRQSRLMPIRRVASFSGAFLLLVLSLGLLSTSHKFRAVTPVPDSFYTYNQTLPTEPGELLKSEVFTKSMPEGVRAWRILYTTTKDDSSGTVLASAFVMAPNSRSDEPQPVVAWTHGTTGFSNGCAPTVMKEPMPLDNTVPAIQELVDNGWVMVGTDYAGLGTRGTQPYLIGQGEGRSALDSVRAAKQLKELNLANKTVVWGHSQGGGAALWTGQIAKSYAPEVNVVGVAAAAPATNIPALLGEIENAPIGKIMGTFALRAYSETYPDVKWEDYVEPKYDLIARELSSRCLAEKSTLVSILQTLIIPGPIYKTDPTTGAFGKRLRENIPTGFIETPVLLAQGEADDLVLPQVQLDYVAERCRAGQDIDYRTYKDKDHVGVVNNNTEFNSDLEKWTQDVLAGKPVTGNCNL